MQTKNVLTHSLNAVFIQRCMYQNALPENLKKWEIFDSSSRIVAFFSSQPPHAPPKVFFPSHLHTQT
jgi:hypothetical protein